jgi:glycopeptide antibiotics resistance protein
VLNRVLSEWIVTLLAQAPRTGLCAWHLEFCKYRGLYQQVAVPFLVLCAIALPAWLVFRLYRLRALRHSLSTRREILLLTFVLYLLCLATLTLTPNRGARARAEATREIELQPNPASLTCSSAILPKTPNARMFCVQNTAGNVFLFFPLGVFLPLVWRQIRFRRGIQIALALSIGIELVQYVSRYRSADVNDVILNAVGACLGLVLLYLLRQRQSSRAVSPA